MFTARRFPTPFGDAELYASIARAVELHGSGVPTMTPAGAPAIDHVAFYGPVFFHLAATSMALSGPRLLSLRVVSLFGAAIYVLAAAALTRRLSGSFERVLLTMALALLTPELTFEAAAGTMHMLAVGLEVLALACIARGLDRAELIPDGGLGITAGVLAGLVVALAALTSPRTYPFIGAFFVAGIMTVLPASARRALPRLLSAALTFTVVIAVWATVSHGSVAAWVRYLAFIATHENTDIAVAPGAHRVFAFHRSGALTPAVTMAAGVAAAWSLRSRATPALRWLLGCAAGTLVLTAALFNYAFLIGEYLALPLFAVVVAWPWQRTAIPPRVVTAAAGLLLAMEMGYAGYRVVCLAPDWAAADPGPVNAFVAGHVPAGSEVRGPDAPFFFPVEGSGSRYQNVSRESWAEWTRWVPAVDVVTAVLPAPAPRQRFLLWPIDQPLPDGYACATPEARYDAPSPDPRWPAWVIRGASSYPVYPSAALYRLAAGCPR